MDGGACRSSSICCGGCRLILIRCTGLFVILMYYEHVHKRTCTRCTYSGCSSKGASYYYYSAEYSMRRKVYPLYVRREGGPPAGVRTKFKRYCCTFRRLELLLFAGSTNEYNSPVFRTTYQGTWCLYDSPLLLLSTSVERMFCSHFGLVLIIVVPSDWRRS